MSCNRTAKDEPKPWFPVIPSPDIVDIIEPDGTLATCAAIFYDSVQNRVIVSVSPPVYVPRHRKPRP